MLRLFVLGIVLCLTGLGGRLPMLTASATATQPQLLAAASDADSNRRVTQALRTLREIEVRAEGINTSMAPAANQALGQLNELAKGLNVEIDKAHPKWGELYQRYQAVRQRMVDIVITDAAKDVARHIDNAVNGLNATDPLMVQKAEGETQQHAKLLAAAKAKYESMPMKEHPAMVALGEKIAAYEAKLASIMAFKVAQAAALWNRPLPDDKPVLVDSIGGAETIALVQARVGRPLTWVPELIAFVHAPGHESENVLVLQVLDGDKPLGAPFACNAKHYAPHGQLAHFQCTPDRDYQGLTETGEFRLKVVYRYTLLAEDHEIANLRLEALAIKHGSANNPQLAYAEGHDMRLSVATLEEIGEYPRPRHEYSIPAERYAKAMYLAIGASLDQPEDEPHARIRIWLKSDKTWLGSKVSCLQGRKKVAEADGHRAFSRGYWTYTDGGKLVADWDQMVFDLYTLIARKPLKGEPKSYGVPVHYLNQNPGQYRCVVTAGGEVLKVLHFEVGTDGRIAQPACQAQSMTSSRNVTLLAQENKKVSTLPYDEEIGRRIGYQGNVAWQGGCPLAK